MFLGDLSGHFGESSGFLYNDMDLNHAYYAIRLCP